MLDFLMAIESDEDRDFVEGLFIRYEKPLKKSVLGILYDRWDADDCVIETVIRVIKYLEKYKNADEKYLENLLFLSCKNVAREFNRKWLRNHRYVVSLNQPFYDEDMKEMELEDPNANLETLVINEYTVHVVRKLLNQLRETDRDVLIFKYDYSMDNETIGKIMGCSANAIGTKLERAKKRLIKIGGEELNELAKGR